MGKGYFKKFETKNLLDSMKVLQFIAFLNGSLPFYLDKDGKTIRLRVFSIIMAVCHYFFIIMCIVLTIQENKIISETYFKSEVSLFVPLIYRVTTLSSITFIFAASLLRRNYLRKTMQLLALANDKFLKLSIKLNYEQITRQTVIMTSILILFLSCYHISSINLFDDVQKPTFAIQVVFMAPYLSMWFYVLIFVTFTHMIQVCLKAINKVSFLTYF